MQSRVAIPLAFVAGAVLPLVGLLATGALGLWPARADVPPGELESAIATRLLHASVRRHESHEQNPLSPTTDILLAGMKLYRAGCAGCHGDRNASRWGTTSFYPRPRQFALQSVRLTPSEMFYIVKHGIRYTGMGGWESLLRDDDLWKIVTFLSRIDSLPEPVATEWNR